jgi:hypothetical protein
MRFRLVHTQALLWLTALLVAVLAMGAPSAWNRRNGVLMALPGSVQECRACVCCAGICDSLLCNVAH